jgi:xanthine dehydrogenase YagS FAD-binding subunit
MRPFNIEHVETPTAAMQTIAAVRGASAEQSPVQLLAGGTTLVDLMRLDVMRPEFVVDINGLERTPLGRIDADGESLRLGAMVRMADAAEHPVVKRDYPVIAQALALAASQQIRNMASLGGNVMQRTRCSYFRDISYAACNKRRPGSGCAALDGFNRSHAILGVSDNCIATYPGDFAQALVALDASVDILGPKGNRTVAFAALHRPPGDTPDIETTLKPGEMIASFNIPARPWTRRSLYLKIRDRESYEFALASAAVALDLSGGSAREVRVALGGVATVPWRAKQAEDALRGNELTPQAVSAAADTAFAGAVTKEYNAFKVALGKRTLIRALNQAAAMEI